MIFRLCTIIILNVQLALARYSNFEQEDSPKSGEELIFFIIFLIVVGYAIELYKKTVKESIKKDIAKKYLWYIPALVLLIAILPLQIEFYQFVRTVIFIFAIYIAYKNYSIGNKNMTYVFIVIGIIFNIFIPVYLPKVIWIIIDVCVIYILVSNANSFIKREKIKETIEEKEYFENEANKNENTFFDENQKLLADYIISRYWTKKEENAIAFARTLIYNMGYEKSYDYIKNTSNDFYDIYMDIYSTIHCKEEDIFDCDALNIMITGLLNQGLHDIIINLSKKENDIINITFSWENYKDLLKKEINKLKTNYREETLEIMSERLMKYMCHIITYRNTTS